MDNKIEILKSVRVWTTRDEVEEAIDVAIDTMRKYQKIMEILNDDTYYEEYGNSAERFIVSAISEVVVNGKID